MCWPNTHKKLSPSENTQRQEQLNIKIHTSSHSSLDLHQNPRQTSLTTHNYKKNKHRNKENSRIEKTPLLAPLRSPSILILHPLSTLMSYNENHTLNLLLL